MNLKQFIIKIEKDFDQTLDVLQSLQFQSFQSPDLSSVDSALDLFNLLKVQDETQLDFFPSLYQAIQYSKDVALKAGIRPLKKEHYLSDYNIKSLERRKMIRGSIKYDEDGKVLDASLCIQDIHFWSSLVVAFAVAEKAGIFNLDNGKGKYSISLFDSKEGKTVTKNKSDAVIVILQLISQAINQKA